MAARNVARSSNRTVSRRVGHGVFTVRLTFAGVVVTIRSFGFMAKAKWMAQFMRYNFFAHAKTSRSNSSRLSSTLIAKCCCAANIVVQQYLHIIDIVRLFVDKSNASFRVVFVDSFCNWPSLYGIETSINCDGHPSIRPLKYVKNISISFWSFWVLRKKCFLIEPSESILQTSYRNLCSACRCT